ncbi:MAG: hypothetical protein ACRDJX_09645 [Solirubrobacteraceae bacterium]
MDPIHPIAPGPPTLSPAKRPAVERLEPISRERDRLSKDAQERRPRQTREPKLPPEQGDDEQPDDGGRPHIDVRV